MATSEELLSKGLALYKNGEYMQAVSYFRAAAEMSNKNAILELGNCYWHGKGVKWSVREALKYYKQAAEQGDSEDQYNYGAMCMSCEAYDEFGDEIVDEGIEWLKKAASRGSKAAKDMLADLGLCEYESTYAVKQESKSKSEKKQTTKEDKFDKLLGAFVDSYSALSLEAKKTFLGSEKGTTAKPVAKPASMPTAKFAPATKPAEPKLTAEQWYEKAKTYSQANNKTEAYKCYLKAAEMGHASAMCSIGVMLQSGSGVARDLKAAFEWIKKSYDKGYKGAVQPLADCYQNGSGVTRDLYKARDLYHGLNDWEFSKCCELIKEAEIMGAVPQFTSLPDYSDGYVIEYNIGIENLIKLLNHKEDHMRFSLRSLEFENEFYITATLYVKYVGDRGYFNRVFGDYYKYQSRLDNALERDYNASGASEFMHIIEYRDDYRQEDYERAKSRVNAIVARTGREKFLKSALISLDATRCWYNIIGTKNGKSRRIRKIILNWLD